MTFLRYPGKLNAVVIFKTREDAMYSYIDNHEQIINGGVKRKSNLSTYNLPVSNIYFDFL